MRETQNHKSISHLPSAARWMTCVGLYFANSAFVAAASLKPEAIRGSRHTVDYAFTYRRSPSRELAKIQVSPGFLPKREPSGSVSITYLIAWPTRPLPPVTSTILGMLISRGIVDEEVEEDKMRDTTGRV
jgi:hypothetical protein